MGRYIPQKLTVMGLMSILLITTSDLAVSILLTANHIVSSIVTTTKNMKEENENQGNHHDDDGIINYEAEENGLEDDQDFYEFHNNEDVTSEDE